MRMWIAVLLAVGIGTVAGMQWWQGRGTKDVENGAEDTASALESAADEPPVAIDADQGLDGQVPDAASPTLPETQAEVVQADEHGAEIPGGSIAETEAELRRKALALIDQAAKSANPIEQARILTRALREGALPRDEEQKALASLDDANRRGLLNPRVDEMCMRTEVRKGDSLWAICKRVEKEAQIHVTPGLIRLVNGLASDAIYPGAKLKVPNVQASIVVEKSRFRLSVYIGDIQLRRYLVGLGKSNRTPEGEFLIGSRLKDPPWYKPGVGPIPPEDPENILGTRWLGFAAKEGFPEAATFGIHGTRDESTIGTESSNGCVRMKNAEVEDLFELIPEGVKVQIVP